MNRTRILGVLSFSAILMVAAGCGERSRLAVDPGPGAAGTPNEEINLGRLTLLGCTPLPYDSVSATIGAAGGDVTVGPHTLSIPEGALDSDVTITAVIESGNVNAIRFSPEGLQFTRKASLTMSYANCDLLTQLLPKRIVFASSLLQILEATWSTDSPLTQSVTGKIKHFSDYAVAW